LSNAVPDTFAKKFITIKLFNMNMKQHILVIGSSNTDMVIKADRLPRPGETVLGGTFFMNPGGKGANQAVSIARLGGQVTFICKTGNDIFGNRSKQLLEEEGIDTSYLFTDLEHPSGVALITVDSKAENCIVVASGANANLLPADLLMAYETIEKVDIILIQLEIPIDTVKYVLNTARKLNKKVILNPAPAQALDRELLQSLYLITPNETEAETISGIKITGEDSLFACAKAICEMGVQSVIITLGVKGAFLYNDVFKEHIPGYEVNAVDTTAAGDVFNAALTVAISEGCDLTDAIRFANKAAAISVTRIGAQSSAPFRNEMNNNEL
jgi:ribokinase